MYGGQVKLVCVRATHISQVRCMSCTSGPACLYMVWICVYALCAFSLFFSVPVCMFEGGVGVCVGPSCFSLKASTGTAHPANIRLQRGV